MLSTSSKNHIKQQGRVSGLEEKMKLSDRKAVAALDPKFVAQVREALATIKHPMKICLNPEGMSMDQAQAIASEFKAL